MSNILFIGLGTMGYPMAGHLAKAGHNVAVYNRTQSVAEKWIQEYSGSIVSDLTALPDHIQYVMLCVGRDDDVRNILTGEHPLLDQLDQGTVVIDHTTTSALLSEEINDACSRRGQLFSDAPVSGGQQGAINGQLSLMTGADSNTLFDDVKAITAPYTKAIQHMGPAGAGQKTKMVNQICITGLVEALSEGILFAQKAGLDVDKVMQLVSQGAAGSWQLSNRYKTMLAGEYDHGFAVELMCKDLDICLDQAGKLGLELPVATLVSGYYRELMLAGHNRKDTSSLLLRLQELDAAKAED